MDVRRFMQWLIYMACVAVVVGIAAYVRLQKYVVNLRKEVADRITEAQAHQLITSAQIRALMFLCAKVWKDAEVQMPDDKSVEQVLQTMSGEQREYILKGFAKVDPKGAVRLRNVVEKSLRGENPFK